jgi:hypothetical protein
MKEISSDCGSEHYVDYLSIKVIPNGKKFELHNFRSHRDYTFYIKFISIQIHLN